MLREEGDEEGAAFLENCKAEFDAEQQRIQLLASQGLPPEKRKRKTKYEGRKL